MKVKAKRNFKHENKDVKTGDVLDVHDHVGQQLVQKGDAEVHHDPEEESGTPTSGYPPSSKT